MSNPLEIEEVTVDLISQLQDRLQAGFNPAEPNVSLNKPARFADACNKSAEKISPNELSMSLKTKNIDRNSRSNVS